VMSFIKKYIFDNSEKNPAAAHIFLILCVYTVITLAYFLFFISVENAFIRLFLNFIIIIIFIATERSSLNSTLTAFVSPTLIALILIASAAFLGGDSLLFIYSSCVALISLTYFSAKGLAAHIITVAVCISAALIAKGIFSNSTLLGSEEDFSMIYNVIMFIASLGLNALAYSFCIFCAKMTNTLIETKNEANLAAQTKGTFLANMSHEIRTPMNAIIGMTSIGLSAVDNERKDYCFHKIEDVSTHLLGIINDILDMSKIEAGKFDLSPTEFNFEKMLQRVVNVINLRVNERQQKLTIYIDRAIPKNLIGDDHRIAQVITNLLGNAVKFTPEKGFIRIGTQYLGEADDGTCTIQISITDTGIGISPEQQERLFRSFQQAEVNTTRKFGGTGLGLSISKNIVEMMGGRIWIESEIGAGSKFAFTIQVKRGAEEQIEVLTWGNLHILAVDNDPYVLSHFNVIAKSFGLTCDTAESYEEALSLVKKNALYDFCFINHKIQSSNSLLLAKAINDKSPKTVLTLMISASAWFEIENEAKAAGVQKFLSKPLFPTSVADVINTSLGLNHKQDEEFNAIGLFSEHHILLAEDVEINREIVLALLEPTLLNIHCAENGVDAVKMFSESPDKYELILMDVQMPDMDGYEATRQIRSLNLAEAASVPIIAMTANVFKEDVEKCLEAGMNGHIGKPLDFNVVLEVLQKYLI